MKMQNLKENIAILASKKVDSTYLSIYENQNYEHRYERINIKVIDHDVRIELYHRRNIKKADFKLHKLRIISELNGMPIMKHDLIDIYEELKK